MREFEQSCEQTYLAGAHVMIICNTGTSQQTLTYKIIATRWWKSIDLQTFKQNFIISFYTY